MCLRSCLAGVWLGDASFIICSHTSSESARGAAVGESQVTVVVGGSLDCARSAIGAAPASDGGGLCTTFARRARRSARAAATCRTAIARSAPARSRTRVILMRVRARRRSASAEWRSRSAGRWIARAARSARRRRATAAAFARRARRSARAAEARRTAPTRPAPARSRNRVDLVRVHAGRRSATDECRLWSAGRWFARSAIGAGERRRRLWRVELGARCRLRRLVAQRRRDRRRRAQEPKFFG